MFKRIVIAGNQTIAVEVAEFVLKEYATQYEFYGVKNKNDKQVHGWQPSFYAFCQEKNIPLLSIEETYALDSMLFLSLQYDQIIRTKHFQKDALLVNMHFSLLPEYKGMYPIVYTILHGKSTGGVTLHLIEDGIDTGDLLAQTQIPISLEDTAFSYYKNCLRAGTDLVLEYLPRLLVGDYSTTPQPAVGGTYFPRNSLDFSNIQINLNQSSWQIYNQLRAFIFPVFQLPKLQNSEIESVTLTNDFIGYKAFFDAGSHFELAGIDGKKIVAVKKA